MIAGVFWLGSLYVSHLLPDNRKTENIDFLIYYLPSSCVVASIVRLYYFALLSKLAQSDREFSGIHCNSFGL